MSASRTFTVPDFGPNDILTSDQIDIRAVKVSHFDFEDGLYIQSGDLTVQPNSSFFISITNFSTFPLAINQMLGYSSCPKIDVDGNSLITLDMHVSSDASSSVKSSIPTATAVVNSTNGSIQNVKGFLVDIWELDTLDTLLNSKFIRIDSHCIVNNSNAYIAQDSDKDFLKPVYIAAGAEAVLLIKNTGSAIADMNFTLAGKFVSNLPGVQVVPFTVDDTETTVDSDLITVDKTEV